MIRKVDFPVSGIIFPASLYCIKRTNKSVESNGRVVLSWSFHVVREFDLAAGWRFPPVPHLLRSAQIKNP